MNLIINTGLVIFALAIFGASFRVLQLIADTSHQVTLTIAEFNYRFANLERVDTEHAAKLQELRHHMENVEELARDVSGWLHKNTEYQEQRKFRK